MKEIQDYREDIASIRQIMEGSFKVISLSGLSGILAGCYALVGSAIAFYLVHLPLSPFHKRIKSIQEPEVFWVLLLIAVSVLVASLATGYLLSARKAKKLGIKLWTKASKRMLINLAIPLITGGLFSILILVNGHYGLAAPILLIFYGTALLMASPNTFEEVRYLGYSEILLGLIATTLPGYGLHFWAIGFGLFHIIYGTVMYRKYDL